MFDLLEEALSDASTLYYITIDRLDEAWVDDALRYRLIKALVDTVKEFGKVHRAKVIVSLRIDLIERVFRETRSEAGFQEEKYRSLNLPLKWTSDQLVSLLNKRISQLMKDEYTKYEPRCEDILPRTLVKGRSGKAAIDYILERTWMRPRDVIDFFNACISKAEGQATFSKDVVFEAEGEYSRGRLRSLATEWHGLYPSLPGLIDRLLKKRNGTFILREIGDEDIDEVCLNVVCGASDKDVIYRVAEERINSHLSHSQTRSELIAILYRTGVVGLKTESYLATRWADNESYSVSPSEIDDECHVSIHPALWRVLGID